MLRNYSLEQLIYLREEGWKSKETEARVLWGVLGEVLNGKKSKREKNNNCGDGVEGLNEFAEAHNIDTAGPWTVNS